MASVFGILAGLSNIQFGFVEAMKGNIKPENFMFVSDSQPALTIIPNYLFTGILGMFFALVFVVWSAGFVRRKNGGLIMIFIAILQLLFGASLIRIPQEIVFGIIGTRINQPLKWWRRVLPTQSIKYLAVYWPWSFIICAFLYFIHIETGIIESFFGAGDKMIHLVLIIISAYFNLFLFIFMIIAGFAYDICRQEVV